MQVHGLHAVSDAFLLLVFYEAESGGAVLALYHGSEAMLSAHVGVERNDYGAVIRDFGGAEMLSSGNFNGERALETRYDDEIARDVVKRVTACTVARRRLCDCRLLYFETDIYSWVQRAHIHISRPMTAAEATSS